METLQQIARGYAESIKDGFGLSEVDQFDAVHEVIDGCAEVNYYHKAATLVYNMGVDELEAAEEEATECYTEGFYGYNDMNQKLAYFALVRATLEALEEL